MFDWMLEAPPYDVDGRCEAAFAESLTRRNAELLPASLTRWVFLEWLTRRGFLLHGSNRDDLVIFEPRTPNDRSPDEFSKRTAVFAASDGLWALMYALSSRPSISGMLNMAVQVREDEGWSGMRYFLSLAPRDEMVSSGRDLLHKGSVYVLPAEGFEQMPGYDWPELGAVLEPHWASPEPVRPLMRVPVTPNDFPLPVKIHEAKRVDALAAIDPWGFPWLER
jgi:hypothetical protein